MNRIKKQSNEMQTSEYQGLLKKSQDDIFAEDFQFEIETSRKNTENRTGAGAGAGGLGQQSYIERLEAKIQNQAKRLSELEKYKYKTEKRLKQSQPDDETLFLLDKSTKTKESSNQEKEKYDNLYSKYLKLLNEYNILSNANSNLNRRKPIEGDGEGEGQEGSVSITNSIVSNISADEKANVKLKEASNCLNSKLRALSQEKEKITESLRQEALKVEEQKNIISLLKKTLDSEFIKSGVLTKHITPANLIDFTQIKTESENYRKQLVLSQALVDSLKSEIEELLKDKDAAEKLNKELVSSNERRSNAEKEMNSKVAKYQTEVKSMRKELNQINSKLLLEDANNSYETRFIDSTQRESHFDLKSKLDDALNSNRLLHGEHKATVGKLNELKLENEGLKNKIAAFSKDKAISIRDYHNYSQLKEENVLNNQRIEELNKNNLHLRKLIDEADRKLSDNHALNKEIKARMQSLELELKKQNNDDMNSNQYILNIKGALKKLSSSIIQYSHQYYNIAKEDDNSLFNQHFSTSIASIIHQLNNLSTAYLNQHQHHYKPDSSDKDKEIIEVTISLIKLITNEFQSIYSKVFESNHNCKESNIKANILEEKLKEDSNSFRQDNKTLIKQLETMNTANEQSKGKLAQLKRDIKDLQETISFKDNQLYEANAYSALMSTRLAFITNDKDRIQSLMQLIPQFIMNKALNKLVQEYIIVNDSIFKLTSDKIKVEEKLLSMQREFDKMKAEDSLKREREREGSDLIHIINKEQSTLKELLYELQSKINDNQSRLNDIKAKIKQFQYASSSSSSSSCVIHSTEQNRKNIKLNMTMSDPHMFNTIHHEPSAIGRKELQLHNQYSNKDIKFQLEKGTQLTDYEDSDLEKRTLRSNNNKFNANGMRTMRGTNNNLTYQMNKK